jgi:predicted  nucleic acid-binding Zn-ribbon protein
MALKASPNDQAHLLELQALDTRIQQLDHKAKMLPQLAVLATLESESTDLRVELLSATGALEDAQRELKRIESDVAVVEARIKRDSDRLQASTSVKDVAGLESELAGLSRRRGDLEEIELGVMERVEELEGAARGLRARHDDLRAAMDGVVAERDESLGVLTSGGDPRRSARRRRAVPRQQCDPRAHRRVRALAANLGRLSSRMGRQDGRVIPSGVPRNVRAPQSRTVGNSHPG